MYFSKATNGFYHADIHEVMPGDVVEISEEHWANLINEQGNGKMITSDDNGYPIAVERPPYEPEVLTPVEKLAKLGLTKDDLKELLGI